MTTEMCERPVQSQLNRVERTPCDCRYSPCVDIVERAEELTVIAEIPGAKNEDIDVRFENGTLTIHAKVELRQVNGTRYLLSEYGVGDFHRSFEVSELIDADRISAEYTNGVLTLHLPKTEAVKPRKIAVETR
ncbi:MAG: Hsp20/alpha crystallin family protein [Planctomycetota bacterium]